MNSFRELNAIFTSAQKWKFLGLFAVEFIGSVLELLGVSILVPFMQVLIEPEKLMANPYVAALMTALSIKDSRQLIIFMILVMISIFVLKNVYLVFMQYVQYQIVWHSKLKMELEIMEYYVRKPYIYHVQRNAAEMQRIILTDIGNVFSVVNDVFFMIAEIMTCTMLGLFLLITNWQTTLTLILLMLAFLLLYFKIFRKRLLAYGRISQEYGTEGLKNIEQIFHGIKEIKIRESEDFFINEFQQGRVIQMSMLKRAQFFGQVPKYLLEMFCTCGVLLMLLVLLLGGLNPEDLVAQLAVFALAAYRMLPAVNRIMSELASIFSNKASIDVIYEAMRKDNIDKNRINAVQEQSEHLELLPENCSGDIEMKGVFFHYPESERMILEDVDLYIHKGSSSAFKGPSGAGKTTTIDLILGVLSPDRGQITYSGVAVDRLGHEWCRRVGYIPQTIYLSDDTIRRNVAFGRDDSDDDKIWKALEGAQLKDYVMEQPEGLDSRIGEGGVRISGGQRQRIGIARALYDDPEILVLDEATSALDTETESAVMESVDYLKGKKTIIIIAHRLSTIENCDEVYEVDGGKVTRCR